MKLHRNPTVACVAALLLSLLAVPGTARARDGAAMLAATLAQHDPEGAWSRGHFELTLDSERPDGTTIRTVLDIDNRAGVFIIRQQRDGHSIVAEIGPGEVCHIELDGSSEIEDSVRDDLRLTCERWRRLRDYYGYMWGLPMKLADAGTQLGAVARDSFGGESASSLRVTYDEATGSDIWYFYFHPQTAGVVGYRFFHDESKNDGEYILVSGELEAGGVVFPKRHEWYVNADDEYLGSDELVAVRQLD